MPGPPLAETVAPGRCAVLTMEVQRGVIGDLSGMGFLVDAVEQVGLVSRLARLLDEARRHGVPVVHCRAAFREDRRGSYANVPMVNALLEDPDHLRLGSPAADLVPALGPAPGDLDSVRLHGMSPFTGTGLDATLRSLGVRTVIATGASLNVGIPGLVIEAIGHGYDVVLPTDCVVGVPVEYGEAVIQNSLAGLTRRTTSEKLAAAWS